MPNFIENVGLDFLWDEEESRMGFVGYLTQNGKGITGYYGYPSLFNDMGSIDIFVKTTMNDEGKLEVVGIDTHCCGSDIWEMRNTGIDITPKDSLPTERVFMFKSNSGDSGFIPIHLINADVLPSFLEDDVVKMQMCAFPLDMNYYVDEDDYAQHQPETKDGKRWLLADGAFIPAAFLNNHSAGNSDKDTDYSTDAHVLFRGTVKDVWHGTLKIDGEKINTFIRCVIDTQYGELQFAHTIDQIEPEQRENIKAGAVVWGVCVLSGDVAIMEYENGIVKDFENNFRLLRHTIVKGQAERMRPVLCEDAVYVSDASGKTYEGIDNIVERLNYVHSEQSDKVFATPATITKVDGEDLEYPVGTRCLLISYKMEEDCSAIAFIDVTESGYIKRIFITTDGRYHFKADEKAVLLPLDEVDIIEDTLQLICKRAMLYKMIGDNGINELAVGNLRRSTWGNNAERILEELGDIQQMDYENALENIFGYLFAKAIEMTYNESQDEIINFKLAASYNPADALKGVISSTLPEDKHQKIVSAMEKGKEFYQDFKDSTKGCELSDKEHTDFLIGTLILVQRIGEMYALKYLQ